MYSAEVIKIGGGTDSCASNLWRVVRSCIYPHRAGVELIAGWRLGQETLLRQSGPECVQNTPKTLHNSTAAPKWCRFLPIFTAILSSGMWFAVSGQCSDWV